MSYNFAAIEKKWQRYWLENKTFAALDPAEAGGMAKAYVLDMFPYPSGSGLHVGHPEGYTATDIVARYRRMQGFNVLHTIGWDAFGLPAEQHAIKTGQHPRLTTDAAIANFRRQLQMLGFSFDWDREIDTTDPGYYRWTQWIFLQLFNSYFDPRQGRAMPVAHLINELINENYVVAPDFTLHVNPTSDGLESIAGVIGMERRWRELSAEEQRDFVDAQRLAYMDEAPVNWCPGLGTVLANEEVIDGKSEVGDFPVERRPMRQWMLRITAYSERLLADLELLAWPESLKEMQRNWIGRSVGAQVTFEVADDPNEEMAIDVFTTRPDTLYGATYMVLAPEHMLVDRVTSAGQRRAVDDYRRSIAGRSERDRMADAKDKTGAFTGGYAINPINDKRIPIYIADYVLMGYGTGAIMAVPAHDPRDYDFAVKYGLEIVEVVKAKGMEDPHPSPPPEYQGRGKEGGEAFEGDGVAINSPVIDGLETAAAKKKMIDHLEELGVGKGAVKYKLRDWLFSRQRYWGEPFPVLLDGSGRAEGVEESELPVELPVVEDFKPTGTPEPPLSKAKDWLRVRRGDRTLHRETNTMPQWAGSCWYYLRYIDPKNSEQMVDPAKERYWMPVDLYVGGAEHAVLHLLYARFWHKVLFDLGHVSTPEPFARLVNQGTILGETEYTVFETADGRAVSAAEVEIGEAEGKVMVGREKKTGQEVRGRVIEEEKVEKSGEGWRLRSNPAIRVDARSFKMSKSRGNVVNPDDIVRDYGADTFRLYEMYMGPLEAPKPWNTRDIVGMSRFLAAVWRNLAEKPVVEGPMPEAIERQMHRTIKKVGQDIELLRFNTAIAELIKLNNEMTGLEKVPRELAENFTLMLAPLAPHIAEEIWETMSHHKSLARRPWPSYDAGKLAESTMDLAVQVNGKLRDKITVPADSSEEFVLEAARTAEKVAPHLKDKTIRKQLYVTGRLVNFVVG